MILFLPSAENSKHALINGVGSAATPFAVYKSVFLMVFLVNMTVYFSRTSFFFRRNGSNLVGEKRLVWLKK
jgi:hypothetical protein